MHTSLTPGQHHFQTNHSRRCIQTRQGPVMADKDDVYMFILKIFQMKRICVLHKTKIMNANRWFIVAEYNRSVKSRLFH